MDDQTPQEAIEETTTTDEQKPDAPGTDDNGDGLKGGQTTADNFGDVLGI